MKHRNSGPTTNMEEEKLKVLVSAKKAFDSLKKVKSKATSPATLKKRNRHRRNLRKYSKLSVKPTEKLFMYKYEMQSCRTWEYADVFCDINSWHKSLIGDDTELQPIKTEMQMRKEEIANNSALSLSNPQYSTNTPTIEHITTATAMCAGTLHGIIMYSSSNAPSSKTAGILPIRGNPITIGRTPTASAGCAAAINNNEMNYSPTAPYSETSGIVQRDQSFEDLLGSVEKHSTKISIVSSEEYIIPEKTIEEQAGNTLKQDQLFNSDGKSYKCTECSKKYSQKRYLTRHQRVHTGERPFKCIYCQKEFARSSYLKSHLYTHSGEKPYKCTECPVKFSTKSNLIVHQRIHSGEKPYKCTECPMKFSTNSNLTVHQRIHSGEKPFKCTECPMMYTQRANLTKHQQTHSGEKL